MPSLWFIVPVHGRYELASICLRQLRRTCGSLEREGIEATAVVIGDDENLDTARDLGFGIVERNNHFTSRKFNDGIQLALSRRFNERPADYVVPCGSDDWVDFRILRDLPDSDTIFCFQCISFVREDGLEITESNVDYIGGCGIRVYPRQTLAPVKFRPADEDRKRGCDTSILTNVLRANPKIKVVNRQIDPRQIVDWKSDDEQLNTYANVSKWRSKQVGDPFEVLADVYPEESLSEMRDYYAAVPV